MKKEGDLWKGWFSFNDPKARFVVFRFVSGEQKDENNGNPKSTIFFIGNNKPVEGAYLASGNFYLRGRFWDFKRSVDLNRARISFEKEKKFYPDSWQATVGLWDVSLKEKPGVETKTKVKNELVKFYKKFKNNEDALGSIISMYEKLGDSTKAGNIREEEVKANPTGKIAFWQRRVEIGKEKDFAKQAEMLNQLLNEFPSIDVKLRQNQYTNLFSLYTRAKEYDKASDIIAQLDRTDAGYYYNSIAWPLIEKGEQLEKAIAWAKKGIELTRNQTSADKPPSMRAKDWQENIKSTLVMILDTYGMGLLKLGKNDESLTAYEEAMEKGEAADPDINTHYVDALIKSAKYDKVVELGLSYVKKGKDTPDMVALMKEAFAKSVATDKVYDSLSTDEKKGFDVKLTEAKGIKIEEIRKKLLGSRISKSPADFTLKDLNGTPVTLSLLKGKVVIVDFWATWCGPCKMSFPYLQKVYEKYQGNESVKFLAVNTWERLKDYDSQLANAKKFIEDNKYTFPVLVDEKNDDQFKVISNYDVDGIPTKFLIDKKGNIAFKSVGFDGPGMEDELTQQIEILLGE
jgi:thiol-disulfide isomerase/thioredoxin